MATTTWKEGGCHCGAVRFRAKRDWTEGLMCNCSICRKKGWLHGIVDSAEDFRGEGASDSLAEYRFNTGTARHLFCKKCGVSPYYVPRSHPDGVSVNLRCVEELDLSTVRFRDFDGANWETSIGELRSPSKP